MALNVPFHPPFNPDAKPITVQPEEQDKYNSVLQHFVVADFEVKGEGEKETSKLTEEEKFWLSKECILRYLRATRWNTAEAINRLALTLSWRRSYGFYQPSFVTNVEPEGTTGKSIHLGFDVDGRPCMYLIPSRQNTETSDRQLQYTFFIFECVIDIMGPGVETLALLIDFGDKGKSPPMHQARKMLNILQTHYPERLGKAFVINIPWLVHTFLTLIMPFVDPVTRSKIHINPDVIRENLISPDMLVDKWGGRLDATYDHSMYWPALLRIARERKEANVRRWRSLGASVGISEWDYKGGNSEGELGDTEKIPSLDGVQAESSTNSVTEATV